MDAAQKPNPNPAPATTQESTTGKALVLPPPPSQGAFDFKGLEKRLAELIDKDGGHKNVSFGYVVLSSVVRGQYDRAQKELESVYGGFEDFPAFHVRSQRFVEHAKGLVSAIKTKHEVGKSPHINKAKQKELTDRIAEHFVDLKQTLVTIEKIQKSVRAGDLSSTILFFRACFFSFLAIFIMYTIYINALYSDTFSFKDLFEFFDLQWPD